jgi:hypothetical protein
MDKAGIQQHHFSSQTLASPFAEDRVGELVKLFDKAAVASFRFLLSV